MPRRPSRRRPTLRKWQPKGAIAGAGQANAGVFGRLGLVYTHGIKNANVSDAAQKQIERRCPGGVSVAVCLVKNLARVRRPA